MQTKFFREVELPIDPQPLYEGGIISKISAIIASSSGVVLTDQVVQLTRILAAAALTWAAAEVISISRDIAVIKNAQATMSSDIDELKESVNKRTDDRYRRKDHEEYAAQIEGRLKAIENRLDGQSRVISNLVGKGNGK